MNMFDYRNKKDLKGRTTEFRKSAAPTPSPSGQRQSPPQTTRQAQQARSLPSRNRVRNKSRDRWVYNQRLETYRNSEIGPSDKNKPQVVLNPGESKAEADARLDKYRKLMPEWFSGELIKFVFRRHWIHILYIGKIAWIFLPITIIALLLAAFLPFLWPVAGVALAIQVALLIWVINDWSNDYLIVTDRRIIELERVSFLEVEKIEIPLDKVQEVKIATRRGGLEYLFRVGTVTISSSGKTNIVFNHLRDPERIRLEYTKLKKSYFMARTAFRKDRMTNYLENKIWGTPLVNWNAQEEGRALEIKENVSWLERLFPSGPLWENDKKQIVWHTHPWIFFKKTIGLIVGFVLLVILTVVGLPFLYAFNALLGGIASGAALILILIEFFMLWYRYEDWHNDRYIMTDDKITDIVKLPFGFDETQSVVEIRNVQDTEYEKRGVFANWFNFGTVKITTVGGPALIFKNVPNPNIIEDEVSRRKEMLKFIDEERQDRLTADFFATYRDILLHPEDHAPADPYGRTPGRLDDPPRR